MPRIARLSALVLTALVVFTMAAAPATQAKKRGKHPPHFHFAVAVYEETEGTVGIAVKVRNADRVSVQFGNNRQHAVPTPGTSWWWDARFAAPQRQCYPIVVRAANSRRRIKVSTGAGEAGTPGCGGFGRGAGR